MKKVNIVLFVLFVGIMGLLQSCFEDPGTDIILEGTFVEIHEATTSGGLDLTKNYTRTLNGLSIRDSLRVNLVGPHRSSPVNVTFAVDANGTTAVADTHYKFITTGGTTSIPANSSYGYIKFEVLDDNFTPGQSVKLKISLTGTDAPDIKLSENYKTFTRTIRVN
jgi:hypothetical protein